MTSPCCARRVMRRAIYFSLSLKHIFVKSMRVIKDRARKAGSFFISSLVCGLRLTHEGWGARPFNFDFLI